MESKRMRRYPGTALRTAVQIVLLSVLPFTVPANASSGELRGVLVYGHEERTLSLCGDGRVYWVAAAAAAAAGVRDEIVAAIARETSQPYQPVLLVFDGQFVDGELSGFAENLDGMIEVRAVHAISRDGVAHCKGTGSKIGFDLNRVNIEGLQGPPDGLRALHYEYCIPDRPEALAQVRAIDPTLQTCRQSPGRIGCGEDELLCLGHTHQSGHREVLSQLARLNFVREIREAFFE
jgi:hypothetical protein